MANSLANAARNPERSAPSAVLRIASTMAFVREMEAEVNQLQTEIEHLRGQAASSSSLPSAQLHLRLSYAAVQYTFYRPFLHHLARERSHPRFNVRGYECG
ncbi:hypothetical protein AC578_10792 [Pseudocercospora eumusae]|uniref:Uncharacterized protein n=1 Tax=Pseudocercospora eumusae TaxID=321146 RepID=A0A139H3N9_9PEZI|nr:hypothetical protein AC578_10792 [Pseudocercospora eumusae]